MTDTIPHSGLSDRTVTQAEPADEAARAERARTGQQLPRTLHALCEQAAVLVPCDVCWARPGTPCSRGANGPGYHVARSAAARRRSLLQAAELAGVLDGLVVFTNSAIVRDTR